MSITQSDCTREWNHIFSIMILKCPHIMPGCINNHQTFNESILKHGIVAHNWFIKA